MKIVAAEDEEDMENAGDVNEADAISKKPTPGVTQLLFSESSIESVKKRWK